MREGGTYCTLHVTGVVVAAAAAMEVGVVPTHYFCVNN